MMQWLDRIFKRTSKVISELSEQGVFYKLHIASEKQIVQPRLLEYYPDPSQAATEVEKKFFKSLSLVERFPVCGYDASENCLRQMVMASIGEVIKPLYFFMYGEQDVIFVFSRDSSAEFALFEEMAKLFKRDFGCNLEYTLVDSSVLSVVSEREKEAYEYYSVQHGPWTASFMERLSDDISRSSLKTFIEQRIKVYLSYAFPNCYPIRPPKVTRQWREEMMNRKIDLPILDGLSDAHREFFYTQTFRLEQYNIEGIASARLGDVVIDAGCGLGDTACYFSRRVGATGKVYTFEIVPYSAEVAEKNMEKNGCHNVTVIRKALSNKKQNFVINVNVDAKTTSSIAESNSGVSSVQVMCEAITLDEFVQSEGLHVDFIKTDVEGSDIQLLEGAKETIIRDKPTLALCFYHWRDDFWKIPSMLEKWVPEYKLYIRCEAEPVVFAVIED